MGRSAMERVVFLLVVACAALRSPAPVEAARLHVEQKFLWWRNPNSDGCWASIRGTPGCARDLFIYLFTHQIHASSGCCHALQGIEDYCFHNIFSFIHFDPFFLPEIKAYCASSLGGTPSPPPTATPPTVTTTTTQIAPQPSPDGGSSSSTSATVLAPTSAATATPTAAAPSPVLGVSPSSGASGKEEVSEIGAPETSADTTASPDLGMSPSSDGSAGGGDEPDADEAEPPTSEFR